MSTQPVLKVNGLCKKFNSALAVDHIDLELMPGECVAILGPNGAGKTTTCELLEGLIEPDQGNIEVLGMQYRSQRRAIYAHVGVQLQETHLYKKYTVRETIELFASFYPEKSNTEQLIQDMQLQRKQHTRLEHLSGGQKQRVYLACALVHSPKVLFLDEPTTGLDPQARMHLWQSIEAQKKQNVAVILTTHYMEEADKLADRVVIMDQGKVIAAGTVRELIQNHCHARAILTFQTSRTNFQLLSEQISWLRSAQVTDGFQKIQVGVIEPSEAIQTLMQCASKNNCQIEELSLRSLTLEDVFLNLTGRSLRDD
ncbi:MAG: ABC transporter ATP-binding protein [Zetaproteobacteria bacterium]|nr:ABC transporter ATP-binding protein [Zetaproteobacteria bacterium]